MSADAQAFYQDLGVKVAKEPFGPVMVSCPLASSSLLLHLPHCNNVQAQNHFLDSISCNGQYGGSCKHNLLTHLQTITHYCPVPTSVTALCLVVSERAVFCFLLFLQRTQCIYDVQAIQVAHCIVQQLTNGFCKPWLYVTRLSSFLTRVRRRGPTLSLRRAGGRGSAV